MRERKNAPLLFRVGKQMIRSRIRGGHRLCALAEKLGMLDTIASYELPRGIVFRVPLSNQDTRWDAWDLAHYEDTSLRRFCDALGGLSDVTMFDCGAHIGTFSAQTCAASTAIRCIHAFEPNRAIYDIMSRNIAALPVEGHAYLKAVGDVEGVGTLMSPEYDDTAQAGFIRPGTGDIGIVTIDSLRCMEKHVALKIDVEGLELEVLRGARQTVASAERVVILMEAHPEITKRTGRNPVACLQYLGDIRPFQFMYAESGEPISADRPLPVAEWTTHHDVLCIAEGSSKDK
jgi:FkbM family methyltransferase